MARIYTNEEFEFALGDEIPTTAAERAGATSTRSPSGTFVVEGTPDQLAAYVELTRVMP